MFVVYVHGIFTSWTGARTIEHFVSDDGVKWTYVGSLPLASERAIDPTVLKINGTWYLWYKNEAAGSHTFRASSNNLSTWKDDGDADIGANHEAPFVWRWKGAFWDLQDAGKALDAWRSEDGLSGWKFNGLLLEAMPRGRRRFDQGVGHHPWIVLQTPASGVAAKGDEQLVLFYFAHDGRRSYIQLAEIMLGEDGKLRCDRNKYAEETLQGEGQP